MIKLLFLVTALLQFSIPLHTGAPTSSSGGSTPAYVSTTQSIASTTTGTLAYTCSAGDSLVIFVSTAPDAGAVVGDIPTLSATGGDTIAAISALTSVQNSSGVNVETVSAWAVYNCTGASTTYTWSDPITNYPTIQIVELSGANHTNFVDNTATFPTGNGYGVCASNCTITPVSNSLVIGFAALLSGGHTWATNTGTLTVQSNSNGLGLYVQPNVTGGTTSTLAPMAQTSGSGYSAVVVMLSVKG